MANLEHSPFGSISSILGEYGPQSLFQHDKTALVWEHGSRTYGELRQRARSLAKALRDNGLQTGDRVGTILYNRGEIFELYFACAFAGLTLCRSAFAYRERTVVHCQHSEAKCYSPSRKLAGTLDIALQSIERKPESSCWRVSLAGEAYETLAHGERSPRHSKTTTDDPLHFRTTAAPRASRCGRWRSLVAFQQVTQFRKFDRNS
ncbi:AMP-binding protein (plasmid) [Sinorhizobium meliloti]|nr:AMP-binding protein [Sinorhizobium meliloti]